MQPIAIIIIAIFTFVHGIRYDGGARITQNNDQTTTDNYLRTSENFLPAYNAPLGVQQKYLVDRPQQTTFVPSEVYQVEMTPTTTNDMNFVRNSNLYENKQSATSVSRQLLNAFRPSQVIDFTLNDATQQNVNVNAAANNMLKQLKFPNEQLATPNICAEYYYNECDYNNKQTNANANVNGENSAGIVPLQLQSTPILTYKDPYINENYHYTNVVSGKYQQAKQQDDEQQQQYLVHSSLYVGDGNVEDNANNRNGLSPSHYHNNPYYTGAVNAMDERLSYDHSTHYPVTVYQNQPQKELVSVVHNGAIEPPRKISSLATTTSNYANNFGNYLPNDYYWHANNAARPQASQRPLPMRPFSNYDAWQQQQQQYLGNIPEPTYRPHILARPPPADYRPHGTVIPAPPPMHGWPTLSSLFSTTKDYAPQFSNLFLNGMGSGNSGVASSSLLNRPQPFRNMQVIKALENIARNDDLQCVPKVLCQMIAAQTQRGQLPAFITSPTLNNFLSGFAVSSPMLIYGRAALLGVSGGQASCTRTYLQCPKNEYEILYYLNNHRGGFFKFFSEPQENLEQQPPQRPNLQQTSESNGGSDGESSFFDIISAFTGVGSSVPASTTAAPVASTTSLDNISKFFTSLLSGYLNGAEYQRRRRRFIEPKDIDVEQEIKITGLEPEDEMSSKVKTEIAYKIHSEIKNDIANANLKSIPYNDVESRVLHKDLSASDKPKFFPEDTNQQSKRLSNTELKLTDIFKKFNAQRLQRKLKFPTANKQTKETEDYDDVPEGDDVNNEKQVSFIDDYDIDSLNSKLINDTNIVHFMNDASNSSPVGQHVVFETIDYTSNAPETAHHNIIFPDQNEQQHVRKRRILNRPYDYLRTYENSDKDLFRFSSNRRPNAETNFVQLNSNPIRESRPSTIHFTNNFVGTTDYYNKNHDNYNYYNRFQQTTKLPKRHKDDENIYVTNGRGETEYYITPNGRKIYL